MPCARTRSICAAVDRADDLVDAYCAVLHRDLSHHRHRGLVGRVAGDATPAPFGQRRAPIGLGRRQLDSRPQWIALMQQRHPVLIRVFPKRCRYFVEKTLIGEGIWPVDHRAPGPCGYRDVGQQRLRAIIGNVIRHRWALRRPPEHPARPWPGRHRSWPGRRRATGPRWWLWLGRRPRRPA